MLQAMEYTRRLRDDRGKGNIVVVEDGEENADEMGADEFEVITSLFGNGCSVFEVIGVEAH